MFENFGHFFKKVVNQDVAEEVDSKLAAKERLQLVLMQDRANVSADFLELMKQEILDVVKKYIEIDESTIDVRLTTQVNEDGTNGEPTLYANIPIVNIKNELKAEKISNQLEFADLIEAQNKEEIENAKGQESSLFKQASTQETIVLNDETMQKISEELNTQKQEEKQAKQEEKQAKKAEKQAKQEEKKQNAIKAKEENKSEVSSKSDKAENSSDKSEPKKVVEQSKQENKQHVENKPNSAKEEVHNKQKVEENKESHVEEHKKEEPKIDIKAETQELKKEQTKQKSSLELLKDAIEQEAADLDELQKELDLAADEFSIDEEMSLLDELDDDDDEDEDFVTFDDLYQAAQEADKKREINNKNKSN